MKAKKLTEPVAFIIVQFKEATHRFEIDEIDMKVTKTFNPGLDLVMNQTLEIKAQVRKVETRTT